MPSEMHRTLPIVIPDADLKSHDELLDNHRHLCLVDMLSANILYALSLFALSDPAAANNRIIIISMWCFFVDCSTSIVRWKYTIKQIIDDDIRLDLCMTEYANKIGPRLQHI